MSVDGWNTVLVLGGIRSGKSRFAESLVSGVAAVRYVATAAPAQNDDQEWMARIAAHRDRRPAHWQTDEIGADPARLAALIAAAKADEILLVDDLGGWVAARLAEPNPPDAPESDDEAAATADPLDALAAAIGGCAARLVIVSPEVGLSLVPATQVGRAFADLLGEANQRVAAACDAVVLVVAGQPVWVKPTAAELVGVAASLRTREEVATTGGDAGPAGGVDRIPATLVGAAPADGEPADTRAAMSAGAGLRPHPEHGDSDHGDSDRLSDPAPLIEPGMDLPMPDEEAVAAAHQLLASLDSPGVGLGELERVVTFAASTQSRSTPRPWRSPRLLVLYGDHAGGAAAGEPFADSARRARRARAGAGALGVLAAHAGAALDVIEVPTAEPMEVGPALSEGDVEEALRLGWRLAADAIRGGADVLIIGACGAGTEAAATAVMGAVAGSEPAAVLPRAIVADEPDSTASGLGSGKWVDDAAWMARCAAVRDALHRTRRASRTAHDVLAELGGGDIAVATGVLLSASAQRVPVLLDGPVGMAATLISRDLAGQARHWCLLPDHGDSPLVRAAADVLGLIPFTELRMNLGEGATALAALPLLNAALEVVAAGAGRTTDSDTASTRPGYADGE